MVARTLIPLLSILALAHCVSIDDRELEEHGADDSGRGGSRGGSSSGGTSTGGATSGTGGTSDLPDLCQRDPDDDDCFACDKAMCCTEYQACFASADCLAFVSCGSDCASGDDVCLQGCLESYPEGYQLFADFSSCGTDACGC
jgi:hypothetical protein